jgi:hypothetical protein
MQDGVGLVEQDLITHIVMKALALSVSDPVAEEGGVKNK